MRLPWGLYIFNLLEAGERAIIFVGKYLYILLQSINTCGSGYVARKIFLMP